MILLSLGFVLYFVLILMQGHNLPCIRSLHGVVWGGWGGGRESRACVGVAAAVGLCCLEPFRAAGLHGFLPRFEACLSAVHPGLSPPCITVSLQHFIKSRKIFPNPWLWLQLHLCHYRQPWRGAGRCGVSWVLLSRGSQRSQQAHEND